MLSATWLTNTRDMLTHSVHTFYAEAMAQSARPWVEDLISSHIY